MNKSTANEVNMSVDDSFVLSSGVTDVLSEILDCNRDEQLNSTIEQFKQNQEQNDTVELNDDTKSPKEVKIEQENENSTNCESIVMIKDDQIVDKQIKIEMTTIDQDESKTTDLKINGQSNEIEERDLELKITKMEQKDQVEEQNSTNEVKELNLNSTTDESMQLHELSNENTQNTQNSKINTSTKSIDMSIDESLILADIRNIFETSTSSSEFTIFKPSKNCQSIEQSSHKCTENEMETSYSLKNDSLILKSIKNNLQDNSNESPFLKSLPPPKQVFKLSRKRLNCETDSPKKASLLNDKQFRNQLSTTPLIASHKKWRSATYNPMTSSPKKMESVSPLKSIDRNVINDSGVKSSLNNMLSISNLNLMMKKSDQLSNLMGDYSNTYALPLINGRHKDLKTISPETLLNLMDGKYSESINCFTIIDSRYPYEWQAGHIDGSKNIYHKEDINKYFFGTEKPTLITNKNSINNQIELNCKQSSDNTMQRMRKSNNINEILNKCLSVINEQIDENNENSPVKSSSKATTKSPSASKSINDRNQNVINDCKLKRHAIIFHCEFSSERGPTMARHLRKVDRELNENCYPNLYYPEIYLLHGGYKMFFERFKDHCFPQQYLPMSDSSHKEDLMKFKKKSKTWTTYGRVTS